MLDVAIRTRGRFMAAPQSSMSTTSTKRTSGLEDHQRQVICSSGISFRSARNCGPVRRKLEHGRRDYSGHCGKIAIGLGIT
jgi:hypothetical protein